MAGKGKILLVTYYWPPSGGPGVQRWLKLVKYLTRQGWQITVYTPSNPESGEHDESLLADVPNSVRVLKRRIFEPLALYHRLMGKRKGVGVGLLSKEGGKKGILHRLMLWVRANLFVPDARCFWVRPSIHFLRRFLHDAPHDVVVTTGPPHSMHLIGLGLKRATGIAWVADFRDPWVNIDYHQHLPLSARTRAKHIALEREVVEHADAVSIVAEGMKDDFAAYNIQELTTIFNGFDAEDFATNVPTETSPLFRLVYAGSMNADRNPNVLWQVLREMKLAGQIAPDSFRVELVGMCDASVAASIHEQGLEGIVLQRKSIAHNEVAQLLCGASMLLLCVNRAPTSKAILTGKLFEYLASGRPILAIAPREGEAAQLLTRTQCGRAFDTNDAKELKEYLLESLLLHKEKRLRVVPSNELAPYSREHQAEQFSQLFEKIKLQSNC